MVVRRARPADARAVAEVLCSSFGDEEGGRILEVLARLREQGDVLDELVADDGGAVGVVALSRAWLDARARLVDVAVLGPLGVVPDRQGEGIGTTLLAAAVEAAGTCGVPLVFLEGDPGFYAARGWSPASDHGLERPSVRIPEQACRVVLLPGHEAWMAGRLVYPDAWWRLDLVGLRDPLLAEIEGARD